MRSVDEGFAWFESFLRIDRGDYDPRRFRLARMRRLLAACGDPHRAYNVVHITGSKGKGSTAAFLGSLLHARGLRCGIYSSPHVVDYRERVRILGGELPDETALSLFHRIERIVEGERRSLPERELPTTFELITLYGFLAFREAGCDIAVVEVGIGGRTDATNIVDPVAAVITPIELEHTDLLGPTHRSIAGEKGAIIARGRPVFLAHQNPEARATLLRIAQLRRAAVHELPTELQTLTTTGAGLVTMQLRDMPTVTAALRMPGRVQALNAALAALVVRTLYPETSEEALVKGLISAWVPGRSELVPGDPLVLLDGAHTPDSIRHVAETAKALADQAAAGKMVVLFGAVAGKEHTAMLRILADTFHRIIITTPGTFKASDVHELLRLCRAVGGSCELREDPEDALHHALLGPMDQRDAADPHDGERAAHSTADDRALIVVTGSFYLVGEVRRIIQSRRGAREDL